MQRIASFPGLTCMANRLRFLPVLCLVIAGFTACKSKCACTAAPGMNLSLISFGNTDIDTMVVKKFVKASGFTGFLDSVFIDTNNSFYQTHQDTTDVVIGISGAVLSSDYDYEILFPSTGIVVKITAIDESHPEGNCSGKTQCTDPINSYKINDSLVTRSDPFDNKISIWE
ncbi:MAG TPA: hypothetical protein VK772_12020 [Puia sp.]|nr:hypothetical protein [Puia sp.]